MNKDTFYIASVAQWLQCDTPEREPDYKSGQGSSLSEYWFDAQGVVRRSNHWFAVAFCYWPFVGLPQEYATVDFRPHPKYKAHNSFVQGKLSHVTARAEWYEFSWQSSFDKEACKAFFERLGNQEAVKAIDSL